MIQGTLAERLTEGDEVRRWRLEALVEVGYDPTDALILSRLPEVDLHVAVNLVSRGCAPATAVQILL